jgi:hypothetical protein
MSLTEPTVKESPGRPRCVSVSAILLWILAPFSIIVVIWWTGEVGNASGMIAIAMIAIALILAFGVPLSLLGVLAGIGLWRMRF